MFATWLQRHWQRPDAVSVGLAPLGWLYYALTSLRASVYQRGIMTSHRVGVPVIVVGNITVGGTGKSPLVVWLTGFLRGHGYQPGIVSRGYGGGSATWPQVVHGDSDSELVGDEPVLLARRTHAPVVVDPDRVRAARALLRENSCDVIIADDGLQHLALHRDIEIAVIDGERRFGNEFFLPAGPLREPVSRLERVDIKVTNGRARDTEWPMELVATGFSRVDQPAVVRELAAFAGKTINAVTGIGNPDRFLEQLRGLVAQVVPYVFPDHHRFKRADLDIPGAEPIVMTEKDAVKCKPFCNTRHWYLAVEAHPDPRVGERVLQLLQQTSP